MDKTKIRYIIDLGLLISAFLNFTTGIIKFPALTQLFRPVYRIIPAPIMADIHDWSGVIMILLVVMHLILNFGWIVAVTKTIFKKRGNR